jgi:hypothetical protein
MRSIRWVSFFSLTHTLFHTHTHTLNNSHTLTQYHRHYDHNHHRPQVTKHAFQPHMHQCLIGEPAHRYNLRYLHRFRAAYAASDTPRFSSVWFDEGHEPSHTAVQQLDYGVADYLDDFVKVSPSSSSSTIVILHGDHGINYGPVYIPGVGGRHEQKLPFLIVLVPARLLRRRPDIARHLHDNQQRLVTGESDVRSVYEINTHCMSYIHSNTHSLPYTPTHFNSLHLPSAFDLHKSLRELVSEVDADGREWRFAGDQSDAASSSSSSPSPSPPPSSPADREYRTKASAWIQQSPTLQASYNLFTSDVPANRTCHQARVAPRWCSC